MKTRLKSYITGVFVSLLAFYSFDQLAPYLSSRRGTALNSLLLPILAVDNFIERHTYFCDVLSRSEGHISLRFMARPQAQNHPGICHGGFTAFMAEYTARVLLQNEGLKPDHFESLEVKYIAPLKISTPYVLTVTKAEEANVLSLEIRSENGNLIALGSLRY